MKKRKITLGGYFLLSIGVSALIIHTALPYYCLTSIAFLGWNIYWSYAYVQKRMFILFPMMSFLGALSTIKKRVNFEDVFLNVSAPVILLLFLKVLQYHAVLAIGTMLFAGIIFGLAIRAESWISKGNTDAFSIIVRVRLKQPM